MSTMNPRVDVLTARYAAWRTSSAALRKRFDDADRAALAFHKARVGLHRKMLAADRSIDTARRAKNLGALDRALTAAENLLPR